MLVSRCRDGKGADYLDRVGGEWYSSPKVESYLQRSFGLSKCMKLRRDERGGKGNAYIGSPPRTAFPTLLVVNGTKWTATSTGSVVFSNDETKGGDEFVGGGLDVANRDPTHNNSDQIMKYNRITSKSNPFPGFFSCKVGKYLN